MTTLSDLTLGQSFWIPHYLPHTLNEIMKVPHWAVGAKRKKTDENAIGAAFKASDIPKAIQHKPRRVSYLVVFPPGKRMPDKDAYHKSVRDALKLCGALFDDNPANCVDGTVNYARAASEHDQWGTLVILQDRY